MSFTWQPKQDIGDGNVFTSGKGACLSGRAPNQFFVGSVWHELQSLYLPSLWARVLWEKMPSRCADVVVKTLAAKINAAIAAIEILSAALILIGSPRSCTQASHEHRPRNSSSCLAASTQG